MSGYWSNLSMVFFLAISYALLYIISSQKEVERKTGKVVSLWDGQYAAIALFMVIIATFRLVNSYVGGADSPNYILLFEHCNDKTWQSWDWYLHTDIGFRYFAKFIRLFTENYHCYFFLIYTLLVFSYIGFLKEFLPKRSVYIPCILLIFLYWRSMSSLRSNTAIAVMMLSLILLNKRKYLLSILIGILTLLIHKMAVVYILFFPFYYWYRKKKRITIKQTAILVTFVALFIRYVHRYFIYHYADVDLGGSYVSYASYSLGSSFWDNFWKIAFEQIILGIFMFVLYKPIKKHISMMSCTDKRKMELIWLMCIYDLILIPVCYVMGIWRGYEFFYLPRIVMWCEILYVSNKYVFSNIDKNFMNLAYAIVFSAWMVFRFYSMWKSSHLMPYIFEPFYNF